MGVYILGQVRTVAALVSGLEETHIDAVGCENLAGVNEGLLVQGRGAGADPSVLVLWGDVRVRDE